METPTPGWPAPAKLNLMLRIVGRRADGYHELQTVFQFLDFADELHYRLRDDTQILLQDPLPGVPVESDLCYRAALALQRACDCRNGVEITLRKRLPMGGGLGGGSSDAATTLVALNRLWGCGLDDDSYMKAFSSGIQDLARKTGEGSETLAKGLYDILSASVPAGKAMNFLAVSSKAARGGATTTAVAVDGLTSIMNAFRIEADQVGAVSDLMFATVKSGNVRCLGSILKGLQGANFPHFSPPASMMENR